MFMVLSYSSIFDSTLGYPGEGPPPLTLRRRLASDAVARLLATTAAARPTLDSGRSSSPLSARPQRVRIPNSRLADFQASGLGVRP